jgi:hypothetical protein
VTTRQSTETVHDKPGTVALPSTDQCIRTWWGSVRRSTAQLGQRECTVHQANAALPSLACTTALGHNRRLRHDKPTSGTSSVHPGTSQSCIGIRIGIPFILRRFVDLATADTGAVLSLHTQRALPCGQLAQTDRWFSRLGKAWRTRWIPWLRFRRPTGALPGGRLMTSFATRAGTQGRLVGRVRLPLCPTTAAAAPTRHAPARSLHPAH